MNTGTTLDIGPGTALATLSLASGTIDGGTIDDTGGGLASNGGTLDGVTYRGTLDLTASNSWLTITGGTTFSGAGGVGAGTINLSQNANQNSILNVLGTGTLDNATVNIGGANTWDYLQNIDATGAGAILTLGSKLVINQYGTYAQIDSSNYAGDGIVNDGTINANYAGGVFDINESSPDEFINNGTIIVSNGDAVDISNLTNDRSITVSSGGRLYLFGTVTAAAIDSITNLGGTIYIGGTVNGGTITAPSGGVSGWKGTSANGVVYPGGTLDGVAYQGTLDLTASNSWLTITGGTTFSGAGGVGAGTINLSQNANQNSILNVLGTGTLDNATVNIGGANTWDYLQNIDATGAGAILTLGSKLVINQYGTYAQIDSSNYAGDGIVNDGTINANYAGGVFDINWGSPDEFINNGTIIVSNGDAVYISNLTNEDRSPSPAVGASICLAR